MLVLYFMAPLHTLSSVIFLLIPVESSYRDHDRAVALTSLLMKTMEILLRSSLYPLQFDYKPNIGAEEAAIFLLQWSSGTVSRGSELW